MGPIAGHRGEHTPLLTHLSVSEENEGAVDNGPNVLRVSVPPVDDDDPFHTSKHGSASMVESMMNLAKTCMGTGCLALPFAAKQGGIFLHIFGLLAVALWNVFSAHRLSECWDLLTRKEHGRNGSSLIDQSTLPPPPRGTATLGKVAWYAFGGPSGLLVMDITTVILLLGIIVSYIDAIRSFLQGTPFTTHSDILDAVVVAVLIAPLSVVPDLGYLTKTSAAGESLESFVVLLCRYSQARKGPITHSFNILIQGLSVLGITLAVVAFYGFYQEADRPTSKINWFPTEGPAGASQWFGCIVFGFGIVPLTFNFRESMAEPAKLSMATLLALMLVAFTYIIIGLTLLVLYPNIESDVLSELPKEGIIPVLTRLSMVVVVMATAPLLIVPCGQLIEGKIIHSAHGIEQEYSKNLSYHRRVQLMVRLGICILTVAISVGIPEFVSVLTFVGCFCVAFVGFCIPPCLHLLIRIRQGATSWSYIWIDVVFLVWGLVATAISTVYVFRHSIMGGDEI